MRQLGILENKRILRVSDNFNRANSIVSPGMANTGHLWVPGEGVCGIASNEICPVSLSVNSVAISVIDSQLSNCKITADIIFKTNITSAIVLRTDGTNANRIAYAINNFGILLMSRRVSDSSTTLASDNTITFVDGTKYTLTVVCAGNNFKCFLNNVLKFDITDDNTLKLNTKCGVLFSPANGSIDNFKVEAI